MLSRSCATWNIKEVRAGDVGAEVGPGAGGGRGRHMVGIQTSVGWRLSHMHMHTRSRCDQQEYFPGPGACVGMLCGHAYEYFPGKHVHECVSHIAHYPNGPVTPLPSNVSELCSTVVCASPVTWCQWICPALAMHCASLCQLTVLRYCRVHPLRLV